MALLPSPAGAAGFALARPKAPRGRRGRGAREAPAPLSPPALSPARRSAELAKLALAAVAVVLFYLSARLAAREPWSYDEYYHLGAAREMLGGFPLRAFPWTPFSLLAEHYADKELLFHLLLMPFARLPIEAGGLAGVALGQAFFAAAFAWALRRLEVPGAHGFVLALAALGSMFALRMDMCRPHLLLMGFSVLFLGLLLSGARPWALAATAALFGLAHAGGWIAIAYAGAWAAAGLATPRGAGDRRLLWQPVAWTAAGWLAGQLVHPNLPENFRLLWLQGFVVPFQSTAAGDAALRSQIGTELAPPGLAVLSEQWPAFLAPLLVAAALLRQPRLRTRETLATAALGLGFSAVGALAARRFLELGAPLALLALALVVRERRRQGLPRLSLGWGGMAAAVVFALGALWTFATVRTHDRGSSQPMAMARWLGEHGEPGSLVFTAQWADSAPLFWFAPRLRSLVALDPTFFYVKDPALFRLYVDVVQGRHPDPGAAMRRRFGARYLTLWNAQVFQPLARRLDYDPKAKLLYRDEHYLVIDLEPR